MPAFLTVGRSMTSRGESDDMSGYKPDGIQALVPFLRITGVAKFVQFAEGALGAEVLARTAGDDGVVFYATLRFDDTSVFVQEAEAPAQAVPAELYLYVRDLDGSYRKALAAGAQSVCEPQDHYHGDRNAAVLDKWGNRWWFATNLEMLTDEQVHERRQSP